MYTRPRDAARLQPPRASDEWETWSNLPFSTCRTERYGRPLHADASADSVTYHIGGIQKKKRASACSVFHFTEHDVSPLYTF